MNKFSTKLCDKKEIDNYKRLGINLVPIPKGRGKALAIKGGWNKYRSEHYTESIPLDQDFAVILGAISGNLIVIDFDECNDIQEILNILPEALNKTLVVQTGDGYHLYLRVDELPKASNTYLKKDKYKMEVKSDGAYVIGISCNHYDVDENGVNYYDGKQYVRISRSNDVYKYPGTSKVLFEKLESLGWVSDRNLTISGNGDYNKSVDTNDLAKGNWGKGSRHMNGFTLAIRRFTKDWEYDDVLEEAKKIAQTCNPVPADWYVERWVNAGREQVEHNKAHPENGYHANIKKKLKKEEKGDKNEENQLNKIVEELMLENVYKTTKDGDEELFIFDGRVFTSKGAENIIKEKCEVMVENCTTRFVTEVINKIKRKTYFDRDELNSDTTKIVVLNGILDISQKEISSHSNELLSSVMYPVNYKKYNGIPDGDFTLDDFENLIGKTMYWEYIKSCFTINDEVDWRSIYTLFEMMAYCLIKDCRFDKAMMLIGQGSNGKTVFIDFLQSMFGSDNISNEQLGDLSDDKFKSAELYGKTCNLFADIDQADLWKTGKLKMLISGDRMSAQRKHGHPFTFKNFAKMVFSANRFPRVSDQSNGFFRRFIIVEFKKSFQGKSAKIEYRNELPKNQEERDRIFSLLVEVVEKMVQRGGFRFDKDINDLRDTWNKNSDPIEQFIMDEDEVTHTDNENDTVALIQLHMRYSAWCHDNNIIVEKMRKFNKALLDAGYVQKNSNGLRKWAGLRLTTKVKGKKSAQKNLEDIE